MIDWDYEASRCIFGNLPGQWKRTEKPMSDLVERLDERAKITLSDSTSELLQKAAKEIRWLRGELASTAHAADAEIERLRAALRRFTSYHDRIAMHNRLIMDGLKAPPNEADEMHADYIEAVLDAKILLGNSEKGTK